MFETIKLYSGFFAILIPVLFDIVPYYFFIKRRKSIAMLSDLVRERKSRRLFKISLFFTGIFQALFALLVIQYSSLNLGSLIYLIGCFGTFGIAIFDINKSHFLHHISSFIFFSGTTLGYLFSSIFFFPSHIFVSISSLLIFTIEAILVYLSLKQGKMMKVELIHSTLGSLWILLIYIEVILPFVK